MSESKPMTNQTAASPSERAIKVACERLQWSESTPSAFVLEWARALDSFARVEVLRGRLSTLWDVQEKAQIHCDFRGWLREHIVEAQAQLKEAEEGR